MRWRCARVSRATTRRHAVSWTIPSPPATSASPTDRGRCPNGRRCSPRRAGAPSRGSGVRLFSDGAAEDLAPDAFEALLALDRDAGRRDPYRGVSRLVHLHATRAEGGRTIHGVGAWFVCRSRIPWFGLDVYDGVGRCHGCGERAVYAGSPVDDPSSGVLIVLIQDRLKHATVKYEFDAPKGKGPLSITVWRVRPSPWRRRMDRCSISIRQRLNGRERIAEYPHRAVQCRVVTLPIGWNYEALLLGYRSFGPGAGPSETTAADDRLARKCVTHRKCISVFDSRPLPPSVTFTSSLRCL